MNPQHLIQHCQCAVFILAMFVWLALPGEPSKADEKSVPTATEPAEDMDVLKKTLRAEDPDEMVKELNELILETPANSRYYLFRGYLHSRSERYEQAVQDFSSALQKDPDAAVVYACRGRALEKLGNRDAARQDYLRAARLYVPIIGQSSGSIKEDLYNERGLLESQLSRFFSELLLPENIERFSRRDPKDVSLSDWALFGRVYSRAGQLDEARRCLKNATALAAVPAEEMPYIRVRELIILTGQLVQTEDFESAIKVTEEMPKLEGLQITGEGVVDTSGESSGSYAKRVAIAAYLERQEQATDEKFRQAIAAAEKISEGFPRAAAYWFIAMRQAEQGKLADALKTRELARECETESVDSLKVSLLEITTEGPRQVPYPVYRALAFASMAEESARCGEAEKALRLLGEIEEKRFRDVSTAAIAFSFTERGDIDEALKWLDRVEDDDFRSGVCHSFTLEQFHAGKTDGAEILLKATLSDFWKARSQLEMAAALVQSGDSDGASQQCKRAEQSINVLVPTDARLLTELGKVQLQAGLKEDAMKTFSAALEIANIPGDATRQVPILAHIAGGMFRGGREDQAKKAFELAVKLCRDQESDLQSELLLQVTRILLDSGDIDQAETVATGIADAVPKVDAISSVAGARLRRGDREAAARLFKQSFETSKDVQSVMGLHTPYSVGGSMRLIGQRFGATDIFDLYAFVMQTPDPNVATYATFGGAESLVPDEAIRAHSHGFLYPEGLMNHLLETWFPSDFLQEHANDK